MAEDNHKTGKSKQATKANSEQSERPNVLSNEEKEMVSQVDCVQEQPKKGKQIVTKMGHLF